VASGSVWATARATGFIWDAITNISGATRVTRPMPQGFVDVRCDAGLFDLAAIKIESQTLTFLRGKQIQFGNVRGAAKFTTPDNKDLRIFGAGLELAYLYNFMNAFNSLGGYRVEGEGTGFSPVGVIVQGGNVEAKILSDFDLLAWQTWLPLKTMLNTGIRIPLNSDYRVLSQYLFQTGVGFSGVNVDVFVEYSFEGLINRTIEPKKLSESWWRTPDGQPASKTWEVAFSENPMYVTIGGRYRYPSGMVLYACVPLLLSVNQGSTMEYSGNELLDFPDEFARGITDGFDPWYAKWKIVLQASFPFRYVQTAAEMRRNFLLLKNRKGGTKIDIDERLKLFEQKPAQEKEDSAAQQKEKKEAERLEEIRKRREEIQKK